MFNRFLDSYRNPEYELPNLVYGKVIRGLEEEEEIKDEIKTSIEWEEKAAKIRVEFIQSIGGLDFIKCNLNPEYTGEIDKGKYIIKKIVYQSLPQFYVTANLYVPKNIEGKIPAILLSAGHSEPAKAEPKYQLAAIELVLNGMAVLAVDPPGQGELIQMPDRDDVSWGVHEHSYMGLTCSLAGMNIAKYFTWNLIRSVDFITSLDFIDDNKIGACGNSGGGTQTCYISMVDSRIAVAAPGCYINGRKQYVVKGHAHDSEQNIFNCANYGLDYGDFISCFAPKPFRILSQQYDFFPIEGTLYSLKRAKKIYSLYQKEENTDIVIDKNMHGLSDNLRQGLVEWFMKHFLNKEYRTKYNPYEYLMEENQLLCTNAGNVLKEYEDAISLDQLIYEEYNESKNRSGDLKERIKSVMKIDKHGRRPKEKRINPFDYRGNVAENVFWITEDGLANAGVYIDGDKGSGVTYMFFENGSHDMKRHEKDILAYLKNGDVFIVDVRGNGAVKSVQINNAGYYEKYGTMHKLCNDAMMAGTSMMAMRVNDVLLSLTLSEKDTVFIAYGKACPEVAIATLFSKEVKSLRLVGGIDSFEDIMKCKAPFVPEYEVFGMAKNFELSEIIKELQKEGKLK
ncbi:MAG: acetylxylan esterase [Clostridiales bacterium]|nr:acetylxylan esterase [Clostridiales bacterium]